MSWNSGDGGAGMTRYLRTTSAERKTLLYESDRAYFARPVLVTVLYCEIATRFVYVRDEARGSTYPVRPGQLVPFNRLTRAEQKIVEAF